MSHSGFAKPMGFSNLLRKAVERIKAEESSKVSLVEESLALAIGRDSGSIINYWKRGHVPSKFEDLLKLTAELVRRGGLLTQKEVEQFAIYGGCPLSTSELKTLTALLPQSSNQSSFSDTKSLDPFVIGVPILRTEQFFGRKREVERLLRLLVGYPLQNAAIIGVRRSGKTSLLHYLKTAGTTAQIISPMINVQKLKTYRWISVDFQNPLLREQSALFTHLSRDIDTRYYPDDKAVKFWESFVKTIDRPTVFLMDGINLGLASNAIEPDFWNGIHALCNSELAGKFSFIVSTLFPLESLKEEYPEKQEFLDLFDHKIRLGPFSESEALSFIHSSPISVSEEDSTWMIEQSGKWPLLLQILSYTRWDILQSNDENYLADWRIEGLSAINPYTHLLNLT